MALAFKLFINLTPKLTILSDMKLILKQTNDHYYD